MPFRPGEGGRKRGARNKTTKLVKEAFLHAFDAIGGEARLIAWAETDADHLTEFFKILARLIPQEANIRAEVRVVQPIDEFVVEAKQLSQAISVSDDVERL
jgi:hypothetical protein